MFKSALGVALAVGLGVAVVSSPVNAVEPSNLSLHKQEMADYVGSGEYATDLAAVGRSANEYLVKRIPQGPATGRKLAVVFDVDETLLSNLSHIVANDYGYVPKVWDHWVGEGIAPAIAPVQSVYETTARAGIDIFIITGRKEVDRVGTEKNLRQVGYKTWTKIFYKPEPTGKPFTMAEFKTEVRRQLTLDGYDIIANIGDQASDLANGYAERAFKLPNPFYISK